MEAVNPPIASAFQGTGDAGMATTAEALPVAGPLPNGDVLPPPDPLVLVQLPLAEAASSPNEASAAGGLEEHGFDPVLAHIARGLPQVQVAFSSPGTDAELDDGPIFDVDEIVRQANEPWPDAESDEDARAVRRRIQLLSGRFTAGVREDAEAARQARVRPADGDDSWTVDVRPIRAFAGPRFNPGEGILSGSGYDASRAVPRRRLIKRTPPRRWKRSAAARCASCGRQLEDGECQTCRDSCRECGAALEEGRCTPDSCANREQEWLMEHDET